MSRVHLKELAGLFLKLGLTAFGGPRDSRDTSKARMASDPCGRH